LYITSVGGTTLSTAGPGLGWVSEKAWNWAGTSSGSGATGGGVSTVWPIPAWQQGVDMTTNQGSTTMRNIPDVAMVADKVFSIANNGQQMSVGGTSVAAPLWAAFMALVNQQAAYSGQSAVGFLNPAVYALGQSASYTSAFHDVTTGNNTNSASPTRFYARGGYDLCTGWGTPAGRALINALAPPLSFPVVVAGGATLLQETCSPGNGVVDPGEVVVVGFSLQNLGGVDTTNLTATLLSSNGVAPATTTQSYGALVGGGQAVTRQFTFSANGICGGTVNPILQLQDGSNGLGTVSFTMPLGTPTATFSQNFDSVVPPVFPSGWTVARTAGATNWVTSSAFRDTVPNAAFAYEATNASVSELISPPISIASPAARLVFRNYYNTEVYPDNPALAYDGGVLEISVGGSAFTDILAAGGSFASGGYTHTVSTAENPLDGRQAWAGISRGFQAAAIDLPASTAGQTVKFKWRFGVDNFNGFGAGGWYVDSVAVQEGYSCCSVATNADVSLIQSLFPNPGKVGQNLAYTFVVNNLGPGPAVNVTFSDTLPANAPLLTASPGYTTDGGILTWRFGLMPAGSSTNLLLLVTPAGEGWVTNNAVASTASFDPELGNNTVNSVTPILAPPVITLHPVSQVAAAGSEVIFAAAATGSTPLAYQWRFNSSDLPGQTSSSLLLPSVDATNMGNYVVVVTNAAGSVTSTSASLRVLVPAQLTAAGLVVTATNVAVSLASVQGLNYTLEYKNSLTDAAWTPISGSAAGNGSSITLLDTNVVSGPTRFYRVSTQ
ncbi:MAG TPA: immunoglobulin domain-containing protein, partial [Verrucomicrobiae bacterium]